MAIVVLPAPSRCSLSISPSCFPIQSPFVFLRASHRPTLPLTSLPFHPLNGVSLQATTTYIVRFPTPRTRATVDDRDHLTSNPILVEEEKPKNEVEESVKVLKNAAKSRKVATGDILSALSVIEKAKLDPSGFLEILGGTKSPGRTWMLIFTAEKQVKRGRYFPLTAVQRFDTAISQWAKETEIKRRVIIFIDEKEREDIEA
ncbi:uncharacterized protein LOC114742814 isoform X2 [Neltuma alba]|uniref:uncharacterized protein LOC114742814 isoform X2 n=1 Tax=Neltuma alba TaxID=207710 RepID=UPI0010A582E2|nr:uncharacterized protein LOC114742814 isoform X2 [Prosopis alba]